MVSFGRQLQRVAESSRIVPRLVSEAPEEWRLGPLTVALDRRRGTARLRYARIAVARAVFDAEGIMRAWRRAMSRLAQRSLAPEELLPRLAEAYRAVRARTGAAVGERVAFVEVRNAVTGERRDYTRAQFAWDLARLVRERRLGGEQGRIDLGVATGAAAHRPSCVVWIEDASGAGHYYLHFRIIQERR